MPIGTALRTNEPFSTRNVYCNRLLYMHWFWTNLLSSLSCRVMGSFERLASLSYISLLRGRSVWWCRFLRGDSPVCQHETPPTTPAFNEPARSTADALINNRIVRLSAGRVQARRRRAKRTSVYDVGLLCTVPGVLWTDFLILDDGSVSPAGRALRRGTCTGKACTHYLVDANKISLRVYTVFALC